MNTFETNFITEIKMKNRINEIKEKINKLSKQYKEYLNRIVNDREYELEEKLNDIINRIEDLEEEMEGLKSIYVYSK